MTTSTTEEPTPEPLSEAGVGLIEALVRLDRHCGLETLGGATRDAVIIARVARQDELAQVWEALGRMVNIVSRELEEARKHG
jgi:hypothetical protein